MFRIIFEVNEKLIDCIGVAFFFDFKQIYSMSFSTILKVRGRRLARTDVRTKIGKRSEKFAGSQRERYEICVAISSAHMYFFKN